MCQVFKKIHKKIVQNGLKREKKIMGKNDWSGGCVNPKLGKYPLIMTRKSSLSLFDCAQLSLAIKQ